MPYLLPETPLVESLECAIVFFPADEAYRRALLGHLTDLTKPWFWQGNAQQRQDAIDSWDNAIAETIACWPP